MPGPAKKSRPNPFFVILLVASTAFAITAWIGYVGPLLAKAPARVERADPGADPQALAEWFNRHGTTALTVEFAVMLVSGLLAMATDKWFSPGPTPEGPAPKSP